MKGILIDPFKKTVRYVETSGQLDDCHGLPGMYSLIGCDTVDARAIGFNLDSLWFDDNGILGDLDQQEFFMLGSYPSPFAGRGLILGTDEEGGCVTPSVQLALIQTTVRFPDNHLARRIYSAVVEANRVTFGNMRNVIVSGPAPSEILPKES